jgi:hypothetical protein
MHLTLLATYCSTRFNIFMLCTFDLYADIELAHAMKKRVVTGVVELWLHLP